MFSLYIHIDKLFLAEQGRTGHRSEATDNKKAERKLADNKEAERNVTSENFYYILEVLI